MTRLPRWSGFSYLRGKAPFFGGLNFGKAAAIICLLSHLSSPVTVKSYDTVPQDRWVLFENK
jgi:hypothetical protein